MANIGYRSFNGSTDLVDVNLGNIASANSVPETWMFAGKTTSIFADGEIVHSAGYDPLDWYVIQGGAQNYQLYDGSSTAGDGPAYSEGGGALNVIVVVRRGSGTAARWSIATHNGSVWSAFTHTNSATTFSNRTYAGSGVLEFANTAPIAAQYALVGRCNTAISDGDVATLTTDMAAWQALASLTNLWRFDTTPVTDIKGTATQNTLTGTTVTANGFPLDAGSGAPAAIDRPPLLVTATAVARSYYW